MPRILFHTQYYPPEIGAPQARLSELAQGLSNLGFSVSVLTAMPNYPKGKIFSGYRSLFRKEILDGVTIYRTCIIPSQSASLFKRMLNYFSFVFSSFWVGLFLPKPDLIITESPPLFLGISGYLLSRLKRAKWIFNIADLWPRSAVELGLIKEESIFFRLSAFLESFFYHRADLVTGQSQTILADITSRFSSVHTYHLSNGVDPTKYNVGHASSVTFPEVNKSQLASITDEEGKSLVSEFNSSPTTEGEGRVRVPYGSTGVGCGPILTAPETITDEEGKQLVPEVNSSPTTEGEGRVRVPYDSTGVGCGPILTAPEIITEEENRELVPEVNSSPTTDEEGKPLVSEFNSSPTTEGEGRVRVPYSSFRSPVPDLRSICVLYAGLHGLAQGLDLLLDAAQALQKDASLHFVLVGDGPEKPALIDRAKNQELKNVTFLDPLPKSEIPDLLKFADIIIVPLKIQLTGAVPSKLYEAMAAAKPIILIAGSEAAQIVHNADCGIVVHPGDIAGLISAIKKLSLNPSERNRLGANGRLVVLNKYSWHNIVEDFARFLRSELIK